MNGTSHRLRYISKMLRFLPPEMPGKVRLGRLLLSSCLYYEDIQLPSQYGCAFVVPSLREPIGFHILVNGIYEPTVVAFILSQLKAGFVFVDIGANIGVFTVPAAKRIGPSGHVLAIEPSPRIFSYLKQNVTLNKLSNVGLRQCAAFSKNEKMLPFYEAPIGHFGMGALAPQFRADPIFVQAQTLDNMLNEQGIGHVDVIKVDVEGFEAMVFQGAERLLTGNSPPLIAFEFCDWAEARLPQGGVGDAQRLLRDYGYEIQRLSDYVKGRRKPLNDVVTNGFEMLVAVNSKGY